MSWCPNCGLPYDVAKRRRITDLCGHERCHTCYLACEPCVLCQTKGFLRNAMQFSSFRSSRTKQHLPPGSPSFSECRRRTPKTNGHLTMMGTLDLILQRRQPASVPATPRLVRSSKARPRPDCVGETKTFSTYSSSSLRATAVRLFNDERETNDDDDIYSNCLDLSNEGGYKDGLDDEEDCYYDNDHPPPPPHLAQQMLSNRLNNLLILPPRNGENGFNHDRHSSVISFASFSRNGAKVKRSNAGGSDAELVRQSPAFPIRYIRQSQESIMSLMSSSSTSGLGHSQSPLNQSRNHSASNRRGHFNNSGPPSSGESSRSSLTDVASYNCGISARKQIYRRSARNLSIKPELVMPYGRSGAGHSAADLPVKPLPFEVPSVDTETPFVGREWLFHELYEILVKPSNDNGMRGAVIYGGVGTGKTAVSHTLAHWSPFHSDDEDHPPNNYVNICVNNEISSSVVKQKGPGSSLSTDSGFISSSRVSIPGGGKGNNVPDWRQLTADSVAVYHFCQIENQVTCTLADFLRNLVATLAYNPNFASYRELLASRPDLHRYLTIGELSKDPATAIRLALTEPLNELKKCNKIIVQDQNYLVVIDSLDEAEYHRPEFGDSIGSFLVKNAETLFPSWLKLVLTVKTVSLDHLKGLRLHKINLDNTIVDERVFGDSSEYARQRINEGSNGAIRRNITCVGAKLSSSGSPSSSSSDVCPSSRFADHLVTVAKGNFLYLKLTLNLIEKNHLVMKGANYKVLPVNLSEVFLLMFNLKFPTVRAYERVAPVLNVILASLYPLTAKQIFEAVNSGLSDQFMSWEEFCERLLTLQDYLVQRHDDTYVLFHPAFRDWLIRREDGQSPKFLCDLRNGHALLALRLCRTGTGKLSNESVLELGHHMLKAHLYKHIKINNTPQDGGLDPPCVVTGKDCQLHWLNINSDDIKRSLCTERNVFLPNTKVSRLLLLAGADPDARTDVYDEAPLLCVAARHGRHEFVALLLEFGADVCACDSKGLSPLMHAAFGGNLDAVQLLHQHGAKLSQVDNAQKCALVHAAYGGHVNVVSFFLQCDWTESYCQSDQERQVDDHGQFAVALRQQASQQAFVAAAEAGQTLVCQFLLDFGDVSINEPDAITQDTALSIACLNGCKETVAYLLANGARIAYGRCDHPKPPFIQAVASGCWEIVSMLLAKGVDVDAEQNEKGETPLIVAAQHGHIGVMELLLSRDANMHAVDNDRRSALCWACINNRASCAGLLIERGSKLDSFDKHGKAPHHYAAQYGGKQLVQLLLDAAPITESPDACGLRPLEIAIQANNVEAVQRFLRKGAKLSPQTWAAAKDNAEVLLILFNKLLDDGHVLYKKGRLDDAAHRFQYALKKLNVDCEGSSKLDINRVKYHLLLNLARCKRKSGDREAAVKLCTEAAQLEPDESEAYYSRARCFYESDNLDMARVDLLRILKTKPTSKEAADLLTKISERTRNTRTQSSSQKCKSSTTSPTSAAPQRGPERVPSPKSWEQGSSDSGNIPDIDAVKVARRLPSCTSPPFCSFTGNLAGKGEAKNASFESEL